MMLLLLSRTMPRGAAMEMLCFDLQIGAQEAKARGLVTDVFPDATFPEQCRQRLHSFTSKPMTTLMATKRLMRRWETDQLLK